MAKTKKPKANTNSVSGSILKEVKACRPLRLFINKQKKKGNEENPLRLRSKFLQLSNQKQTKYFQKAIDKYVELLDEKDISKQTQIDEKLFDTLLSKKEQNIYFESIDAPTKPFKTAAAYYAEEKKQENTTNPKPWKTLSADERKPYTRKFDEGKTEYALQVKSFSENLPERLKTEYLEFINPTPNDNEPKSTIKQRRQSVQSVADTPTATQLINDNHPKLTRSQLDDLHKCKPDSLYFEKKFPDDDDKPTFANSLGKNNYIRSLFKELSEKKRHKLILKSTKKWQEYLEANPAVTEQQIPTLHLLLTRQDDIFYYFSSLGLPARPPNTAMFLFQNERKDLSSSQQNWADLSQTTKDNYIKRLANIKNDYHEKFVEFVEKTLPNDYIRLEFFRNVKYAVKDFETSTKDRVNHGDDLDDGQLKITQYLKPKTQQLTDDNEFDRIKQQLLATNLNNEQKKLVEKLGDLMDKFRVEKTSNSKSSTDAPKRKSTDSSDVILVNGDENDKKKKKKKSRETSAVDETKKRK